MTSRLYPRYLSIMQRIQECDQETYLCINFVLSMVDMKIYIKCKNKGK